MMAVRRAARPLAAAATVAIASATPALASPGHLGAPGT